MITSSVDLISISVNHLYDFIFFIFFLNKLDGTWHF